MRKAQLEAWTIEKRRFRPTAGVPRHLLAGNSIPPPPGLGVSMSRMSLCLLLPTFYSDSEIKGGEKAFS